MSDPIEINRRNWNERAIIHSRDVTGDYMLDRFLAGEDALHDIEAAELGDIAGKKVLHLQCHIGRDTLCLVRRGATAFGLDFSHEALRTARRLAYQTGLPAEFVHGRVEEAPQLVPGPFDLVFATWGTICWLPDLNSWARAIAKVLRVDGELYLADAHPGFQVMEVHDGRLYVAYDFQTPTDRPLRFNNATPTLATPPSWSIRRRVNGYMPFPRSLPHWCAPASPSRCFVSMRSSRGAGSAFSFLRPIGCGAYRTDTRDFRCPSR